MLSRLRRRSNQNPSPTPNGLSVPVIDESDCWPAVAIRLATMLVAGFLPFAVLLFTRGNDNGHYASPNALSIFGGFWAMFAIWIILHKGMDGLFTKETSDIAWSFIALTNLVGVVFFFLSYMNP